MARFYPSRKLGAALREYRIAIGWTLGDTARNLECDRSKISRIENGERGIHSRDLAELFALYKVPPDVRASLMRIASIPRDHPDADVLDRIIEVEQACARLMKALTELKSDLFTPAACRPPRVARRAQSAPSAPNAGTERSHPSPCQPLQAGTSRDGTLRP